MSWEYKDSNRRWWRLKASIYNNVEEHHSWYFTIVVDNCLTYSSIFQGQYDLEPTPQDLIQHYLQEQVAHCLGMAQYIKEAKI